VRRGSAAVVTTAFFFLAPGVVAGLLPWWMTHWQMRSPFAGWGPLRIVGGVLIVAGAGFLIHAFARFVSEGAGTPAPIAPTEHLVVGGAYRFVRNPMYLAVLSVIVGQALLLGQLALLRYAAIVACCFVVFVRLYEEPVLKRTYGAEYDEYRRRVRGWWPRLHNPYKTRT
jgi:protein-S-isoprenylcysteine O-methyltransferase Ste14